MKIPRFFTIILSRPFSAIVLCSIFVLAVLVAYPRWWPLLTAWVDTTIARQKATSGIQDKQSHSESHQQVGHERFDSHDHESDSIELTPQALKNLELTSEFLKPIALSVYKRTISVPAILAPIPGKTKIQVSSPLSGIVLQVNATEGEAVSAGQPLFDVRLTYEDLVDTQTQFLKSLSELTVEKKEIDRLNAVTESGAISSKSLLERQYAKDKLEAYLTSLREALRLHGLSDNQIGAIERDRKLLRDLSIVAPDNDASAPENELRLTARSFQSATFRREVDAMSPNSKRLIVEDLKVSRGQGVSSGEMLCALSDFSHLYIEGQAFERDASAIMAVVQRRWTVDAILETSTGLEKIEGLTVAFVGNSIDRDSRMFSFFVDLPNQILQDEARSDSKHYITWKYRVGQRLQLLLPVEIWENQIVLPTDAVVKEGAEWFVFQQNGDHFDRIAVHVKHRDQSHVVIDNDGAIFPGDIVARKSAHQLQMALKNKSGGGADPHAGHNH